MSAMLSRTAEPSQEPSRQGLSHELLIECWSRWQNTLSVKVPVREAIEGRVQLNGHRALVQPYGIQVCHEVAIHLSHHRHISSRIKVNSAPKLGIG